MSVTNTSWPKYTAHHDRGGIDVCGHQHNDLLAATNCAENLSRRHYGVRVVVKRRDEDGTSTIVAAIATK